MEEGSAVGAKRLRKGMSKELSRMMIKRLDHPFVLESSITLCNLPTTISERNLSEGKEHGFCVDLCCSVDG